MIFLKISGRGGNQFFQYSFVQKFIDENFLNEKIYVSFEHLKENKTDNNSFVNVLTQFNINNLVEIKRVKYSFKQKILDILYRVTIKFLRFNAKIKKRSLEKKDYIWLKKIWQKKLNANGLYYYIPEMDAFYKSKTNNIIFFGSFEDSKEMIEYRNNNLLFYKFDVEFNNEAKRIYEVATNTNSVCITIRRGDFLFKRFINNYYICNENYFYEAIKKMNSLIKNPYYIVFSDDIDWCKNNMIFPKNTIFENEGNTICQKIQLMSQCKHFIISNSTFSWWAQFLSEYPDKNVIAPKKWNKFEYCNPIYISDWILL